MNINTKKVIFIVGATAVGKTDLSINLAEELKTEIISCDSRQFYKELLIGAAPPSKEQLSTIKHHFIHNLSITEEYNAGLFEEDAIKIITEIHKNKETIIAVGGSGLYIDAICKGFDKIPKPPIEIRKKTNNLFKEKGIKWLQKEVKKVDPIFYKDCDQNNTQRLIRALEVFYFTNNPISSFKNNKPKKRPFKIIKIGLHLQRDLLYKKINTRVEKMINMGLAKEAKNLLKHQNCNALNTVGYKEFFDFYNKKITFEECIENIKKNTRRFAKRQMTWFRKDNTIKWFNPEQIKEIKATIEL